MLRAAKSELCSLRSAVVWTNIGAHSSLLGTRGIPLDWHSWVGRKGESWSRHPAICSHNKLLAWWRHQMETFSALLALCAGNSLHKGQWRGALIFSLICAWINAWVNNREAGDLRRYRAHYYVSVMEINDIIHTTQFITWWRHDKETLSALQALCEGNPPVTGGFPSQRASNTELWHTHNFNYYMVVSWPWTISALLTLSEWSPHLSIHDITYTISVTVKPVYNDHLMGYFSAFWSSSRWPLAT